MVGVYVQPLPSRLLSKAPKKRCADSWFWGFDSFIPAGMGDADSNVPQGFFPQAKCALGPPAGPYVKGERNTYTRKFAHAEVFVDLRNRTNSRVAFAGCEYR